MGMVTIYLDGKSKERLSKAAQNSGLSKSELINRLILENLEEIETLEPIEIDLARYQKEKEEGKRMLTLNELKQEISKVSAENSKEISKTT